MRTANPALNADTFGQIGHVGDYELSQRMTLEGTATKTGVLLVLAACTAVFTWTTFNQTGPGAAMPWIIGGAIGGFIMALVTIFKKTWSPVTAPIYALLEGLFLGGISAAYNAQFEGIVFQAICLTFGTLFALLFAYRTGWIRATHNFRLGVFAATGGIFLVYMVSIVLSFFGMGIPLIHESGWVGIGFSAFVVVIAALNLVLDFDFIEEGTNRGAPKYMEWYGAFGLMVTLVWLYVEILRLLAKLRGRD